MAEFKVGGSVKIVEGSRRWWVPAMDKCIGRTGVIQASGGVGEFLVGIDGHNSWWFTQTPLLLLTSSKGTSNEILSVE